MCIFLTNSRSQNRPSVIMDAPPPVVRVIDHFTVKTRTHPRTLQLHILLSQIACYKQEWVNMRKLSSHGLTPRKISINENHTTPRNRYGIEIEELLTTQRWIGDGRFKSCFSSKKFNRRNSSINSQLIGGWMDGLVCTQSDFHTELMCSKKKMKYFEL